MIEQAVKTSPGVEADRAQEAPLESKFGRIVYPRPAQGAISQVAKTSPAAEVEQAQEAIEPTAKTATGVEPAAEFIDHSHPTQKAQEYKFLLCLKEEHNTLWYDGKNFVYEKWSAKTYCKRGVGSAKHQLRRHPEVKRLGNLQVVENSPGVEVDPVEDLLPECSNCFGDGYVEDEFGRVKFCQCEPKLSRQKTQSAIVPAAKNLPSRRSKTSTAHQLLELFKSSAHIIEDSPGVKTEATVSGSAIAPVLQNRIEEDPDLNPILTGIALSDMFLARYCPPQPENIRFRSDADGQLSLLDFEVQSEPEPPDPDDFETLEAFRQVIARWDWEHPSSSDHCSDHLPNSVQKEPNSVQKELPNPEDFDSMFAFWAAYDAWVADDDISSQDNDISSQDNDISSQDKPLEVSLDSFCEWAPCPDEWHEPVALLEQFKVSELSPGCKSSITSDFSIPTFGCWGDRPDRGDEPPDTGIFARSPKPKPPTFPPQASQPKSAQVSPSQSGIPKLSRNYPETIPKLFRIVAGSSTQPARSPPGGDAM